MIYNFLIIYLLLFITSIKCIDIKIITFDVDSNGSFSTLTNDFNEYSKKNGLDITLELILFTSENATVSNDGGKVTIQSLLQGRSSKYDIYFFHYSNAYEFSEHLMDLNGYISKETIELYDTDDIFKESCIINDRLIRFPIQRAFTALYSNIELLEKYDKRPPKTWEELIDTANYIYDEEKKLNDTFELTKFAGMFDDDSNGVLSIFEMLYSYRRSEDLNYPDLKSQEAIDALEMYKKICKFGSSGFYPVYGGLYGGNAIFIKYWAYEEAFPAYKLSLIPGWKEGISVSLLGGVDIGISNYISEDRKRAAAKVLDFFLTREEQKRVVLKDKRFTGIKDLYNDNDICAIIDCDLYKNLQFASRYNERKNYDAYSSQLSKFVVDFVNGKTTADEALDKMNDLVYIHKITLGGEEKCTYGLILFIINLILSLIIIGSSLLIITERFKPLFKYLPTDFWYVIILGILCHTTSIYFDYGDILPYKCQLRVFLYSFGYTLIFVPFLYKLIVNFPEENQISTWISKNRYIFLLVFVFCDVVLALINLGSSYGKKTITPGNNKMYQECQMNGTLAKVIVYLNVGYKLIIFFGIGFLCFVEWNMKETRFDVHVSSSTIYINILSILMMFIFKFINFDSYIVYCILNSLFLYIIVLSNYIVFIGIRIVYRLIKNNDDDPFSSAEKFREAQNNNSKNNSMISSQRSGTSSGSSLGLNKYKKVISYHYQTTLSASTSLSGN